VSGAQRFWRIATQGPSWRADDFSGNVSTGDPGRWNSHGVPVVYCSSSLALCCLETLVHVGGDAGLLLQRWLVAFDVPTEQWLQRTRLGPSDLPCWDATPSSAASSDWGNRWLASRRSLLAAVPSVIVPEESNLLINPRHLACALLLATTVRRWTYDSRLQ
jgi:RES domain-containing protein